MTWYPSQVIRVSLRYALSELPFLASVQMQNSFAWFQNRFSFCLCWHTDKDLFRLMSSLCKDIQRQRQCMCRLATPLFLSILWHKILNTLEGNQWFCHCFYMIAICIALSPLLLHLICQTERKPLPMVWHSDWIRMACFRHWKRHLFFLCLLFNQMLILFVWPLPETNTNQYYRE